MISLGNKFVVTPKNEKSVTMTIRLQHDINSQLEDAALKSGRSRNELINMALKFALDNMEIIK